MTSMKQVRRTLPRPSPIRCACCIVFGCVLPIVPAPLWLAPKLVQCVKCGCYWQLISPKKCICGLEHGQPAQRTMSKVIFVGFPFGF